MTTLTNPTTSMVTYTFTELCVMTSQEILVNFPSPTKAAAGRAIKMLGQQLAPNFEKVLTELGYLITPQCSVKKGNAFIINGELSYDSGTIKDHFDSLETMYNLDPVYYYNKYKHLKYVG